MEEEPSDLRFIPPDRMLGTIATFGKGNAVTHGKFEIDIETEVRDLEWNHMDLRHRLFIHNTYRENVRIALGRQFSVSLTKWWPWPFFIAVTDMRLGMGLFYQSFTLAGLVFIQNIISMEEL